MNNDGVNKSRRTFLIGVTSAVGAVGVVGAAVPFVKSWQPSARAENAGAPVEVDVSKLEAGQRVVREWRGQPIWVVRRTEAMLEGLKKMATSGKLSDPDSGVTNQQPEYARNEFRSIKPEILVLIGVCTHLGCSPTLEAEPTVQLEQGGFFCPYHGSMFDFAGRVYRSVPAPTNLVVPPHSYLNDNLIIIGSEEGETA